MITLGNLLDHKGDNLLTKHSQSLPQGLPDTLLQNQPTGQPAVYGKGRQHGSQILEEIESGRPLDLGRMGLCAF